MEGSAQDVGWSLTRRDVLLVTLSLLIPRVPLAEVAREDVMEQIEQTPAFRADASQGRLITVPITALR